MSRLANDARLYEALLVFGSEELPSDSGALDVLWQALTHCECIDVASCARSALTCCAVVTTLHSRVFRPVLQRVRRQVWGLGSTSLLSNLHGSSLLRYFVNVVDVAQPMHCCR
jgi:hypothetical protein